MKSLSTVAGDMGSLTPDKRSPGFGEGISYDLGVPSTLLDGVVSVKIANLLFFGFFRY